MIDNLGGRSVASIGSRRTCPTGEQWSAYDKGIGGGAFFAGRADQPSAEPRTGAPASASPEPPRAAEPAATGLAGRRPSPRARHFVTARAKSAQIAGAGPRPRSHGSAPD